MKKKSNQPASQQTNFNNFYEEIYESANLGSSYMMRNGENGYTGGINSSGAEFAPRHLSILDIIADIAKQQTKDDSGQLMGYPLQNHVPEYLAEIVGKMADVSAIFVQAAKSDLIQKNDKASEATKQIIYKLSKAGSIMLSLKDNLDDLAIDK